jgi:HK97 gp10 family phage protein
VPDVRVVVDKVAVGGFMRGPEVKALLMEAAGPPTGRAQAAAPKRTGEGAASIQAKPRIDHGEQTVRVAWDRIHFYMFFQERGTKYIDARPFLVPSLTM